MYSVLVGCCLKTSCCFDLSCETVIIVQLIFNEALQKGTMEGFFRLISYFQTQSEPAYCGLASLSVVLNALSIDPGRKWKGMPLYIFLCKFC